MNVFVAALDWGMGHATRTVPIIMQQIKNGHKVIVGASKNQFVIYKEHFPDIEIVQMPSSPPVYSKLKYQLPVLLLYVPKFLYLIQKEHKVLKKIVEDFHIDVIISDNCYGLFHRNTRNILVTHQLNLQVPMIFKPFQTLVNRFIRQKMNQFDECHIPDNEPPFHFSGNLSYPYAMLKCQTKFIGIQSRFSCVKDIEMESYPELVILISGPEQQRTVFENIILNELSKLKHNYSYLIIRGLPNSTTNTLKHSANHLDAPYLKAYLKNAKYIVARSGYSTIMDLAYLGKRAFLVPTPGQTEQEYLAQHLHNTGQFCFTSQDRFDLQNALECLSTHP